MAVDYIPRGNLAFYNFQKKIVETTVARASAWQIPPDVVTGLQTASIIYSQHFQQVISKGTRTSAHVAMHNQSRKRFEKELRAFVKQWIAPNKLITAERAGLGVAEMKPQRHARPAIKAVAHVSVESRPTGKVSVVCQEEGTRKRPGIPKHADGVELIYVLETEDAFNSEKARRVISARARNIIQLQPADAGKMLYIIARWVNLRDDSRSGPYGNANRCMVMP